MKTYRQFLWILLLLVPLLWLVWPSSDESGRGGDPLTGPAARKHQLDDGRADSGMLSRSVKGGGQPAGLTEVDRILANEDITHEEAALQLRELAMNPMSSVEERLEALQHGLNLHVDSFADFAQQKDLPSELASHYLHEMINHDDAPSVQIRAYMTLMDHPDTEVAGLAKDMLALEVGDEERQSTREKLLVVGQGKLAKLEAEAGK